jgi:hypothetical protein
MLKFILEVEAAGIDFMPGVLTARDNERNLPAEAKAKFSVQNSIIHKATIRFN